MASDGSILFVVTHRLCIVKAHRAGGRRFRYPSDRRIGVAFAIVRQEARCVFCLETSMLTLRKFTMSPCCLLTISSSSLVLGDSLIRNGLDLLSPWALPCGFLANESLFPSHVLATAIGICWLPRGCLHCAFQCPVHLFLDCEDRCLHVAISLVSCGARWYPTDLLVLCRMHRFIAFGVCFASAKKRGGDQMVIIWDLPPSCSIKVRSVQKRKCILLIIIYKNKGGMLRVRSKV